MIKAKRLLTSMIFFSVLISGLANSAEKIELIEKWPDEKSGLMAICGERLFFGDIREVRVFDLDLNLRNTIPIKGVGEIWGVHPSSETPDRLYLGLGTGGLGIIDISEPDNVQKEGRFLGSADTDGVCSGISVAGSKAFCATGYSGIQVLDVSNPSAPQSIGQPFLPGAIAQVIARGILSSGGRIFVADSLNGLWSINPAETDFSRDFLMMTSPGARCILPFNDPMNGIWLGGGEKLVRVRLDSGKMSAAESLNITKPVDLAYLGDGIIVADSEAGIRHARMKESAPEITGTTKTEGIIAHSVAASGSRFFAGDHRWGIRSSDQKDGIIPEGFNGPSVRLMPLISGLAGADNGNNVFATVSDPSDPSQNGIIAFDTSTVLQPSVVDRIRLQGEPSSIKISGKTAYVACGSSGLKIIDISGFTSFSEKSSISFSDKALDLEVSGNLAYVAADSAGLRIVDVSDITRPVEKGSFSKDGFRCQNISIKDKTVFVSDPLSGVRIINVTSSESPSQISSIEETGRVTGICSAGDFLYLGTSDAGLKIYDISDPSAPRLRGNIAIETNSLSWKMACVSGTVFIALGDKGTRAVDVSKPEAPVLLNGWKYDETPASGIWARNGDPVFLYLSAERSGLRILGLKKDPEDDQPPFEPDSFVPSVKHSECFIGSVWDPGMRIKKILDF